jgi:hypothetical protein
MRLNRDLVKLLKDLGQRVDEEDKKVIDEALQDVRPHTLVSFQYNMSQRSRINVKLSTGRR